MYIFISGSPAALTIDNEMHNSIYSSPSQSIRKRCKLIIAVESADRFFRFGEIVPTHHHYILSGECTLNFSSFFLLSLLNRT